MMQDNPNDRRMVLVDVVLMRTEDALSTRKGVNLLNALTLQFGSNSMPAFSKTFAGGNSNQSGIESNSSVTALTRAITIPALSYSLNMVNSNTNINEVLARPTLAALNGVRSEFFSGTTLTAAVVATGVSGGSSVQIEKEIGVKLSITPMFMSGNKIRLTVDAQRTFLKPPSKDVLYTYKVETTKIMVNANVVMEFGETLVLGGLSEKETSVTRDGVPVLQDIPGVQYLFSQKDTNDFQRSVLMLITPREPQYTYRKDAPPGSPATATAPAPAPGSPQAAEADWLTNLTAACQARNVPAVTLPLKDVAAREPALARSILAALWLPDDQQVDPVLVLQRLGVALARTGVGLRFGRQVDRITAGQHFLMRRCGTLERDMQQIQSE